MVSTATAPLILVQPTHQTVLFSNRASFTVTAIGVAPLAYQWFQNGTPVAGATSSTLSFPSATVSNAGAYTVTITNS